MSSVELHGRVLMTPLMVVTQSQLPSSLIPLPIHTHTYTQPTHLPSLYLYPSLSISLCSVCMCVCVSGINYLTLTPPPYFLYYLILFSLTGALSHSLSLHLPRSHVDPAARHLIARVQTSTSPNANDRIQLPRQYTLGCVHLPRKNRVISERTITCQANSLYG